LLFMLFTGFAVGIASVHPWIFIALILFFLHSTCLKQVCLAAMSRVAPAQYRGAAMGLYSTFQFTGTFWVVFSWASFTIRRSVTLFLMQALIILLWLILIITKKTTQIILKRISWQVKALISNIVVTSGQIPMSVFA